MKRVGIIAASGRSSRTGLGEYTTKAALPLLDRPLLLHQLDFLQRSGYERVLVVCQPAHVRLLGSFLSEEERLRTAFILSDAGGGWGDKIEKALRFCDDDDEIAIVPCDNYQQGKIYQRFPGTDAAFTFTRTEVSSVLTDGPVFGCLYGEKDEWREHPGKFFSGRLFTGYVVGVASFLREALSKIALSERGEKEITRMLNTMQVLCKLAHMPYPGEYLDISDLHALARLDAQLALNAFLAGVDLMPSAIGAGVLLHTDDRVFLTERQDGFGWVPPGGAVDAGESYVHAAVRELREEAGVMLQEGDVRLLGVYPTIGKRGEPACSVIFHHQLPAPVPTAGLATKEVKAAGWFTQEEAAKLKIPFNLDRAVRDCFAGRELDCRP